MSSAAYDALDEALEGLVGYGIELKNGNSNHAPMVAEALCALGRPQAVKPWIERYKERLLPCGAAAEPIRAETWRGALGCRDRFADWAAFFGGELERSAWHAVLDLWVARLAAGRPKVGPT